MTDFRCPSCNLLLAVVDEDCPRVQVKCARCKVIREYRRGPEHRYTYAQHPEPARQRSG